MSGQNSIVQRLVSGQLTADEKRGVHEGTKQWDKDEMDPHEPIAVDFKLTKQQKLAIYQDVMQRVVKGATPDDIGKAVVACIEQHLNEKQIEAYPDVYGGGEREFTNQRTGKKGGFRRVE
jgi:hypothetical protein